jgi:hypothetical protein
MMYARVVSGPIAPDKIDEAIQLWRTTVVPSARQQNGFKGARLLVDRKAGKVLSMGLWETQPDVQRSVEWNQGQISAFAGLLSAPPAVEEGYELAAEA